MAKIYAPNKQYNGITAGIRFVDGVGETDNECLLEWFKKSRYMVVEEVKPEPPLPVSPVTPQVIEEKAKPEPPKFKLKPTTAKKAKPKKKSK